MARAGSCRRADAADGDRGDLPPANTSEVALGHNLPYLLRAPAIEQPDALAPLIRQFMTAIDIRTPADDGKHAQGMATRRSVLGDAHVDRSVANRTEITEAFQNFITRYAWGEIWTRDGLPHHTRSLITIGLMVALNRSEELALHLRAAKNNGVTRDEIKEVLLQTAIYCGVPAANSAFHLADKLFREEDTAAKA